MNLERRKKRVRLIRSLLLLRSHNLLLFISLHYFKDAGWFQPVIDLTDDSKSKKICLESKKPRKTTKNENFKVQNTNIFLNHKLSYLNNSFI